MSLKKNNSRHIGVWTASAFVISSMIGTGVFTSLGYQLVDINTAFPILLLWLIGGIISLFGAFSYSELASAFPRSGGEYSILSKVYHPAVGFIGGFVSSTIGFSAPAVLAAIALGKYTVAIFPQLNSTIIASVIIILFNLIHSQTLKYGRLIQDWTTIGKIVLIVFFIISGLLIDSPQNISFLPIPNDGSLIMSSSFAVSLVWISYAYTGWNSTVYIAGEVKNPQKNIHYSLLFSTAFVTVLYILLNFIFLFSTPISEMRGMIEVGFIAGVNIFGDQGGRIVSGGIALLLLSTISSYVFIGPRITQVIGEDFKYLGFFSKVNKSGIPINGFIFQLSISLIFILTSTFEQVLLYAGITFIIINTITVIGVIVLRFHQPALNRPYKSWGYPWTQIIFTISNLWILYFTFKNQPFESLIGIGIILISLIFYFSGHRITNKGQ
ncbi:amino acid permease [bacterium]|nr:MAG: amino acid permease [bacterium]